MSAKTPRKNTPAEYTSHTDLLYKLIKTPQQFIHLNHDITLKQYVIWVLALKACHLSLQTTKEPTQNQWLYFTVTEVNNIFGYRSKRNELVEDFENLRKTPITYNVLRKDGKEIKFGSGFISQWSIESDGQIGIVLPDFIVEGMNSLEIRSAIFHDLNLVVFNSFDSQYHAFHYKLFKDYSGVGRTPTMSIQDYRSYMGIKDDEYPAFKMLNNKIIKPSVDAVASNSLSDVQAEAVYIRNPKTRTIDELFFKISKKGPTSSSTDIHFGAAAKFFTPTQQATLLASFTPEQISMSVQRATEYITQQHSTQKAVKSAGAIYLAAIKGNWGQDLTIDSSLTHQDAGQQALPAPSPTAPAPAPAQSDTDPDLMSRQVFKRSQKTEAFKYLRPAAFAAYVDQYAASKDLEPGSIPIDPTTGKPIDRITAFSFDTWLRSHSDFDITPDEAAYQAWLNNAS